MTKLQNKTRALTLAALMFACLSLMGFGFVDQVPAETTPQYNKQYLVINATTGKCLNVTTGSLISGATVDQSTCNGTKQQRWYFTKWNDQQDVLNIKNIKSGLCLDIRQDNRNTPFRLQQYNCHNGPNQGYSFKHVVAKSELGRLEVYYSAKCLDVPEGLKTDGLVIQEFTCHNGTNQQWLLVPAFGPAN